MTDYKDIKKKNDTDLAAFIAQMREEVREFRFNIAGAGTRDVRKVRAAKKDIARGLTELTVRSTRANDAKK